MLIFIIGTKSLSLTCFFVVRTCETLRLEINSHRYLPGPTASDNGQLLRIQFKGLNSFGGLTYDFAYLNLPHPQLPIATTPWQLRIPILQSLPLNPPPPNGTVCLSPSSSTNRPL